MPADTRDSMGSSFNTDFSNVRVHTGNEASHMNEELGAQAFTRGSDIYFKEGKYDTGSSSGKHLLAHELTHTVQQNGGSDSNQSIQMDPDKLTKLQELDKRNREHICG